MPTGGGDDLCDPAAHLPRADDEHVLEPHRWEANVWAIVRAAQGEPSWESALLDWPTTRGHALLRRYSDAVNRRLVEASLHEDPPAARLLKTDLFDEAVGEGLFPTLIKHADSIEGVDVSENVLAAARRRYPELAATRADIRALPFPDASFDAVVSCSTLDHFASPEDLGAGIRELARVLARGGRLLVTLDNGSNPLVALRNSLPWSWLASVKLVPCYVGATCGPAGLVDQLTSFGLDVQRTTAVMHAPRVAALALGGIWSSRKSVDLLLACERLERWPTRFVTGQFVAALAVKR
jgi:SAM-dependent methyltransferase